MEDRVGEVQQDQVSLGVLVTAVPRDVVDAAVAACGVVQRRGGGKLPAHVTAYLTMALCLFWQDDYEEVATKVTGSPDRWGCWEELLALELQSSRMKCWVDWAADNPHVHRLRTGGQ